MTSEIITQLESIKKASPSLGTLSEEKRNHILLQLAAMLRKNDKEIIKQNKKDLSLMSEADPMFDRLLLSKERILAMAEDLERVAALPSPLGKIQEEKRLPNGLHLQRMTIPLGVVAVIYESRPNVTMDVFSLCFKTGNACVLKGGKEAYHSNLCLVSLIKLVLRNEHINESLVYLLPPEREAVHTLLEATSLIDVCIPRGSQALIDFVRKNAKIPIIETGAGIVHTYFDESGDREKGRLIIENAKTRRVSVCNALDCMIIHEKRLNDLYYLLTPLIQKNVTLYADKLSYHALQDANYPQEFLFHATETDFGREFLDYKLAIKTVFSVEEAINHISTYTSGHSEAIIAENDEVISYFINHIDVAVVYVNASTAFTDGAQFGMGAEIGISTQKLHARGPMALDALTSYKWVVFGQGQIRQ